MTGDARLQHFTELDRETIIQRQLDQVAQHPDYLRSMAQIDLQSLVSNLWLNLMFSSIHTLEKEHAQLTHRLMMTILRFVLDKIPNAAEIITVAIMGGSLSSAGNAFCRPEWEDSCIESWFNLLTTLSCSNKSLPPSSLVALSSTKNIFLTSLITMTPVRTLMQALHEPWQWQFAYQITGHGALIEAMPASQRESALAVDLGL
jgi:hypothetical protein